MNRNKLCCGCKNYDNDWCKVRKTNRDLHKLTSCKFRDEISCENCKYRVGIYFSNGYMFGCSMFYEVFGSKNISLLQGNLELSKCKMWESEKK